MLRKIQDKQTILSKCITQVIKASSNHHCCRRFAKEYDTIRYDAIEGFNVEEIRRKKRKKKRLFHLQICSLNLQMHVKLHHGLSRFICGVLRL